MRIRRHRSYIAGAVATTFLVFGSATAIAQQGTTTGPAAGSNVEPSAAAQKQNPTSPSGAGSQGTGQATEGEPTGGAVSAGAPGATAKSGTQGGPPAQEGSSKPK